MIFQYFLYKKSESIIDFEEKVCYINRTVEMM